MFNMLVASVGEGKSGFAESCRWAAAAVAEGAAAPGTIEWVSLGNHGRSPSNAERDFFRWADITTKLQLEPNMLWLPRRIRASKAVKWQPTPIIAIHELFHAISCVGSQQWIVSVVGPGLDDQLKQFWHHAERQEWDLASKKRT